MKKVISLLSIFVLAFVLFSCGGNKGFDETKNITLYTRDSESGTRDGFFTAIGFKEAVKDDKVIHNPSIVQSNGDMIQKVKTDIYGLGYISYASYLETDGLTALNIGGVKASEEAIVNGSYKLSRNFNYVTRTKEDMTADEYNAVYAFIKFCESQDGLAIIKANDGILTTNLESAKTFEEIIASDPIVAQAMESTTKVTLNIGGSTSVENIASELSKAFSGLNNNITFVANHTGSGDAYKNTQGSGKDSNNKLHIGYLSRELKSDETAAEGTGGTICKDGIVAIINAENKVITDITTENLVKAYKGEVLTWDKLKA